MRLATMTPFQEVGFTQGMKMPSTDAIREAIASLNFQGMEALQYKEGLQEALVARQADL